LGINQGKDDERIGFVQRETEGAEPKCWNLGVVFSVERPLSCARTSQVVLWDWMREVWPSFNIENERFSDRRIKRMMRRKLKIATKLKLDRLNRS